MKGVREMCWRKLNKEWEANIEGEDGNGAGDESKAARFTLEKKGALPITTHPRPPLASSGAGPAACHGVRRGIGMHPAIPGERKKNK